MDSKDRTVIRPLVSWSTHQADGALVVLETTYVGALTESGPALLGETFTLDLAVASGLAAALRHAADVLLASRAGRPVRLDPAINMSGHSDTQDTAYSLLQWSFDSLQDGHLEDALFGFYAGQLRRQLEMGLFPPDDPGGKSLDLQRFEGELAEIFNKLAFTRPEYTGRAMTRYEAWVPTLAPGFKPIWACSRPAAPNSVWPVIVVLRQRQSAYLRGMVKLLEDPVYAQACARALNATTDSTEPEALHSFAADMGVMLLIERQKQIHGMATQHDESTRAGASPQR